jgi:hypothetical protein
MTELSRTLPSLPLDEWEPTKLTLHLYLQIVGKVRLARMPRRNHWWNITLYVTPTGLSTRTMPDGRDGAFEIAVNLRQHRVEVVTSNGYTGGFSLEPALSVASFHGRLFDTLRDAGIDVQIRGLPYDLPVTRPFAQIEEHASYDPEYAARFHQILLWVQDVFEEFSGRFYGKTCPVHLYWHHLDLAVTRFSGKPGPPQDPAKSVVERDAYSHEVISFGFWAGDEQVRGPAFYSYTYPAPEGLGREPLEPSGAKWTDEAGSMAVVMYDDLRSDADPRAALVSFLESAYQAGARLAGWDVEGLTVPPLEAL